MSEHEQEEALTFLRPVHRDICGSWVSVQVAQIGR
jgi:hypothetical protein